MKFYSKIKDLYSHIWMYSPRPPYKNSFNLQSQSSDFRFSKSPKMNWLIICFLLTVLIKMPMSILIKIIFPSSIEGIIFLIFTFIFTYIVILVKSQVDNLNLTHFYCFITALSNVVIVYLLNRLGIIHFFNWETLSNFFNWETLSNFFNWETLSSFFNLETLPNFFNLETLPNFFNLETLPNFFNTYIGKFTYEITHLFFIVELASLNKLLVKLPMMCYHGGDYGGESSSMGASRGQGSGVRSSGAGSSGAGNSGAGNSGLGSSGVGSSGVGSSGGSGVGSSRGSGVGSSGVGGSGGESSSTETSHGQGSNTEGKGKGKGKRVASPPHQASPTHTTHRRIAPYPASPIEPRIGRPGGSLSSWQPIRPSPLSQSWQASVSQSGQPPVSQSGQPPVSQSGQPTSLSQPRLARRVLTPQPVAFPPNWQPRSFRLPSSLVQSTPPTRSEPYSQPLESRPTKRIRIDDLVSSSQPGESSQSSQLGESSQSSQLGQSSQLNEDIFSSAQVTRRIEERVNFWMYEINRPPLVQGFRNNLTRMESDGLIRLANNNVDDLRRAGREYIDAEESKNRILIELTKTKLRSQEATFDANMGEIRKYARARRQ